MYYDEAYVVKNEGLASHMSFVMTCIIFEIVEYPKSFYCSPGLLRSHEDRWFLECYVA